MDRHERSRHAGLLRFTRNTGMAAFSFREDNHSACAGWQGFGGGAYQQAFAEVINSALLAATVFSAGQCYILDGSQICDLHFCNSISLRLLIRQNQE